jgi:DNA-binding CsgD family transcriptional regulator
MAGRSQAARVYFREANALADRLRYPGLFAAFRQGLGFADLVDADPGSARRCFIGSLDIARITGVKSYVHAAVLGLALAAGADGDPAVAATLHGVADQQYERVGRTLEPMEAGLRARDHAQLRATLGEAAFEIAYRRGRMLTQADGIALATATPATTTIAPAAAAAAAAPAAAAEPDPGLASAVPPAPLPPSAVPPTLLSQREREIVALLAGGATDVQIAGQLFVSVNTVRSHLDRIRDKTGARRRADLVRYAAQAGIESAAR